MKKLIFGCALMLSGIIGSVGWLIAQVSVVQRGAWSGADSALFTPAGIISLFFFAVAVIGAVIAISALRDNK